MNEMKVFENVEFGKLEIIMINDKEHFPATQCAKILGYSNPSKAVGDHCRCLTKRYVPHPQSPDKSIEKIFIPEGDLYRLIIRSKLPAAERFERWVFDEVIPAIRKHGFYGVANQNQYMALPQDYVSALRALADTCEKNQLLVAENKVLAKTNLNWDINEFIRAAVAAYSNTVAGGGLKYAKAWKEFKSELNHKCRINIENRVAHYHKRTGRKTPPNKLDLLNDAEKKQAAATIVAMCKNKGLDISNLMVHVPDTMLPLAITSA